VKYEEIIIKTGIRSSMSQLHSVYVAYVAWKIACKAEQKRRIHESLDLERTQRDLKEFR